ncbi:tetratricopeptide repeat protein [Agaribacter marinus]|uniref:Tetratricopeptide repeat protein n=1 Tax=Virgibacillus salarius TaxID=447199 RepID=A0A941DY67_9BACI|nr:tetratricopeptide repeat protein [uncultured Virgibacillus sp.]MBR7795563.1 tetratricopeptide repeat protein [Virgibacillus salarius]NAZ08276.1 tetratricopeptide repeat protein [Agaribacter marinus]
METIMEAVHLMEAKQSEKAIELLENYLPMADEEEKYTIAELYIQWGYLQKASVLLQALIQQFPAEGELKVTLADIYIELEDDEAAIQLLNEIQEDDPAYVQTLIQLADLYQAQGLFEVAEQKLLMAKNRDPNEPILDFALAELYFSTGDYRKATNYYEKILPKAKEIANVSINDRIAEAYAASGEYELALTYYQDEDSENPDSLFKYGFTAYQAGRSDIARKAWEHVIEIDTYYHTAYYQLAKVYEEEGLVEKAYETALKGIKVDTFNKELYFMAGMLAHKLENDVESETHIREAIAIDPDFKEAILFLIELLKNKADFKGIIDLIIEIKHTGADDPQYEWELARAYNETESYDNALKHYNAAYTNLKDDTDFLKEYGYFLTEEGRMKEAIPVFEAYLTTHPIDDDISEFLARLKQSDSEKEL